MLALNQFVPHATQLLSYSNSNTVGKIKRQRGKLDTVCIIVSQFLPCVLTVAI